MLCYNYNVCEMAVLHGIL